MKEEALLTRRRPALFGVFLNKYREYLQRIHLKSDVQKWPERVDSFERNAPSFSSSVSSSGPASGSSRKGSTSTASLSNHSWWAAQRDQRSGGNVGTRGPMRRTTPRRCGRRLSQLVLRCNSYYFRIQQKALINRISEKRTKWCVAFFFLTT